MTPHQIAGFVEMGFAAPRFKVGQRFIDRWNDNRGCVIMDVDYSHTFGMWTYRMVYGHQIIWTPETNLRFCFTEVTSC